MNKKILLVHGFMHSSARYKRLKTDLEAMGDCEVTLYELPGFGDTPASSWRHVLEQDADKIKGELAAGDYDYAVGHSMGGNVLLRAMDGRRWRTRVILLSPEYGGIPLLKPCTPFMPVLPLVFLLLKVPCALTSFLIKTMALFTVNRWTQIDERIVADARKASPMTAAGAMFELTWDKWRVRNWKSKEVVLILGEKDRIIRREKMKKLQKDLGKCSVYYIEGIGHTAVSEDYDRLLKLLTRILVRHI